MGADPAPPAILLAVDGEPHTDAAVDWALDLARDRGLSVTAVHIKDPYLKQFENEIYAQGREEYLDHVEACLVETAHEVTDAFCSLASERGVPHRAKVLAGAPRDRLIAEAEAGDYAVVVLGRKQQRGFSAWRSGRLSLALAARVTHIPVVLVPGDS